MLKKDYMVRQLEEFGKVLAMIRNLLKSNDSEKFEEEIRKALKKYTSLEIQYVENLSAEQFNIEVLDNDRLGFDEKKILADLLFEQMHFHLMKQDDEGYLIVKEKCVRLYQHLMQNATQNEFNLDIHYKLSYLGTM